MNVAKQQLREQLKQARHMLSDTDRQSKGQQIFDRLITQMNWPEYVALHCYESLLSQGEVDTRQFFATLLAMPIHPHVFTSRKFNGVWQVVAVNEVVTTPQIFDAIIIPMLGFDQHSLHRLGYGGGYYDRFLATQPHARKIGLCFEVGSVSSLPIEPHDIALDIVITEDHVYQR